MRFKEKTDSSKISDKNPDGSSKIITPVAEDLPPLEVKIDE